MSYGEADSHPSGFEQGNTGYSGAPMWKIKQQTQQYRAVVEAAQAARIEEEQKKKAEEEKTRQSMLDGPKVLGDAVAIRGTKGQQFVRHVLVKDLRKAASVMNMELPTHGIFDDQGGQRALFAIFDGQDVFSPSALAAEVCSKHVLGKTLRNLLSLPASNCTVTFIKACLLKTFEDLDRELQVGGIAERCSASLALVVGEWLFTAVLGRCQAFLCQPEEGNTATSSGGRIYIPTPLSTNPSAVGSAVPDVKSSQIFNAQEPCFVLTGVPVTKCLTPSELAEVCSNFFKRPRACSGEISAMAASRLAKDGEECDSVTLVAFIKKPETPAGEPVAKRAKTQQMDSVRLRHIVVKHAGLKQSINPRSNKAAIRTREEAEALLRETLSELLKDGEHPGNSAWAAKVTPRMINACRNTSECKSAEKGGSSCGDLGWISRKELVKMGKEGFADLIIGLSVGEWSDLMFSEQGAHLVMRMA